MKAFTVASAGGLVFAFYFFLVFAAALGLMIYVLLTAKTARRTEIGLPTVRKPYAAGFATIAAAVLFAMIYVESLMGFHTIVVGDTGVRCDYAVPHRSIALTFDEVGDVIRRPAFKSRWRLEIYTVTGTRFASAPGSYRQVKEAAEEMDRHLRHQVPTRPGP